MVRLGLFAKPSPVRETPQPPANKKELEKQAWDLNFNLAAISYFVKTVVHDASSCSAAEIREAKETAREALRSPALNMAKHQEVRELLFRAFSMVVISTNDEGARRAAEEARNSIPFPFSPKYGQIYQRK
jgi:hypothetical protein